MKTWLLAVIFLGVLWLVIPNATAGSSKHVITYESTWDATDCRLISLYGPFGIDPEYYRVAKLCRGNDGEFVIHYDIPVRHIQ